MRNEINTQTCTQSHVQPVRPEGHGAVKVTLRSRGGHVKVTGRSSKPMRYGVEPSMATQHRHVCEHRLEHARYPTGDDGVRQHRGGTGILLHIHCCLYYWRRCRLQRDELNGRRAGTPFKQITPHHVALGRVTWWFDMAVYHLARSDRCIDCRDWTATLLEPLLTTLPFLPLSPSYKTCPCDLAPHVTCVSREQLRHGGFPRLSYRRSCSALAV